MSRCPHADVGSMAGLRAVLLGALVAGIVLLPAAGCGPGNQAGEKVAAPAEEAGGASDAGALLPADDEVTGWRADGDTAVFRGAELYGHIDGGAEVFLELGFERLDVQHYISGTSDAALELYIMDDRAAAWGIYLAKCGRETPDPGLEARHTVNRYQLQMVRGSLYVAANVVESTGDGAQDQAALVALAARVVPRIDEAGLGGAGAPEVLETLPEAGRVPGSERIARGQFTLQSIVTLGQGDVLRLEDESATAVAADYAAGDAVDHGAGAHPAEGAPTASYSLLLVDYGDAAAAVRAWDQLAQDLDPYLTVLSRTEVRLLLEDHGGRFMVIERQDASLELRFGLTERPS